MVYGLKASSCDPLKQLRETSIIYREIQIIAKLSFELRGSDRARIAPAGKQCAKTRKTLTFLMLMSLSVFNV